MTDEDRVFTVGHSNHSFDAFLQLLRRHNVSAVADVRSAPFSRFAPHFNRKQLARDLSTRDVSYVFLGDALGGRPLDETCYVDGRIRYSRLSLTTPFQEGLNRLVDGSRRERIAVMCTEKDPLDCHRTLLIARQLKMRDIRVDHILADGSIESQEDAMTRLMQKFGLLQSDLFRTLDDLEEDAVHRQEQLIAYVDADAKVQIES
jgi:uncharacterized protein (DUF488 family)